MKAIIVASIFSMNLASISFSKDSELAKTYPTKNTASETASPSIDHQYFGFLDKPIALPNIKIQTSNGTMRTLRELVLGKTTAIHLMYTHCKSSCPIQGRVLAKLSPNLRPFQQIISISVDVANDQKLSLKKWRKQYNASPAWIAATPRTEDDLANLLNTLDGEISQEEPHVNQIYFTDRQGRIVFKTQDFPSHIELQRVFQKISRRL